VRPSEVGAREDRIRAVALSVDDYELGGLSLRQWHDWLTHTTLATRADHPKGGPRPDQVAWLAIALELIFVEAYGEGPNVRGGLEHFFELVQLGAPEVQGWVRDYGRCLPRCLGPLTGWCDRT